MNTCRHCQHWSIWYGTRATLDQEKDFPLGECRSLHLVSNESWRGQEQTDRQFVSIPEAYATVYPHNKYFEPMWTGPDFGCVHYKPRGIA